MVKMFKIMEMRAFTKFNLLYIFLKGITDRDGNVSPIKEPTRRLLDPMGISVLVLRHLLERIPELQKI